MASRKKHFRSKTKNSPIQSTSQTPMNKVNTFSGAQFTTETAENGNMISQQGGIKKENTNFNALNDETLTIDRFMKLMATAMQDLSNQIKTLTSCLNTYQAENMEVKRQLNEIIVEMKDVKAENLLLKAEIDKVYHNETKYMLAIHGVPNDVDEMKVLKKIGSVLEVEVLEHQVSDVYRINTKIQNTPQPIVVKFTNKLIRNSFMANRRNKHIFSSDIGLNNDGKQIYVNEYLTKNALQLLNDAKILKKDFNFKFVWAKNGIIYAKKHEKSELFKIEGKDTISAIILSIDGEKN